MARLCLLLITGSIFLAGSGGIRAAAPNNNAATLAAAIDRHLSAAWQGNQIQPAPPATDAEFVRRVYLDLAGRIPAVAELRAFFDDKRPDKRQRLVEQLLDGPRYVTHFTNVWRALLLPETTSNLQASFLAPGFETWLRAKLQANTHYDAMVRELLTVPMDGRNRNPFGQANNGTPTPIAFYLAKDVKPENLAAAASRLFLGVKIECAQCHNHPFAEWKREQFWGYAAFFAGIKSKRTMDLLLPEREIGDKRELMIPGTERVVQARFIDGGEPRWKSKVTSRGTLAEWMTAPANPYFSRAAVNRMWAYFFGTGLIDPVDEMVGSEKHASHPELLDLLAREFASHRFDIKFLMRAITNSRAYQLSSAATHSSQNDRTLFARMPLRGLTAEQIFDSVAMATGYRDSGGGDDLLSVLLGGARSARTEFLTRFANQSERSTDSQTSILQALSLMNGKVIASATSLERSETLAAIVDAPFASSEECIDTLYLATLSRKPDVKERERAVKFVVNAMARSKRPADDKRRAGEAMADVFWALLNSPEFIVNH
jgi:hypothetical protein